MKIRPLAIFGSSLLFILSACQSAVPPIPPTSTPYRATTSPPTEISTSAPTLTSQVTPTPTLPPPPILSDVRVRQALAYCTNRAGLIRSVYPWLTELAAWEADSFVPPDHRAYIGSDPDFIRYPFSPEQGMALLEAAGWTQTSGAVYRTNADGAELLLTLTTTEARFRQTWAAVWEEQMKACGVQIIRQHKPAEWLFGDGTGLSHRDFEIAAFAWVADAVKTYAHYACDQIPSAANNWRGQNFSGWCNPAVEAALQVAASTLNSDEQRAAYQIVQREYAREVPELPLFYRASVFAINPALENFAPTDDGLHTWNAAQWHIPGQDTIIIGEAAEPAALHGFESAYIAEVIRTLVTGRDVIQQNYAYQPVLLKQLPTIDNGGTTVEAVTVQAGDSVVNWSGEVVGLQPGVVIHDADGQRLAYTGGVVAMRQLVVTYEFVDGLRWADGVSVSKDDYALAYRAMCDPAIRGAEPFSATYPDPFPACDEIASVEFLNDVAYRVVWKPGFTGSYLNNLDRPYFLPPFSRAPAHQVLSDGRRLADTPLEQWLNLDEVYRTPLGVGPYMITDWVFGQRLTLEANPNYFQGLPATPRIVVKFLEHDDVIRALLAGEVDVVDWETLGPEDVEAFDLMGAHAAGVVRVIARPSSTWEHLNFALTLP